MSVFAKECMTQKHPLLHIVRSLSLVSLCSFVESLEATSVSSSKNFSSKAKNQPLSSANTQSTAYQDKVLNPENIFEARGIVSGQYEFWREVFEKTGSKDYLIHDVDVPNLIVERVQNKSKDSSLETNEIVKIYFEAYQNALDTYSRFGKEARLYGPMEKKLWQVYSGSSNHLQRLLSGGVRLRYQQGLNDDFKQALIRSQKYLPYMERVFIGKGLPKELTRIAFVESMFNPTARSKVGAAGIWQIMPSVAKSKILMTHLVDERLSPYKATPLAADHLLTSYRKLGSWPLAIMAYNHGPAGVNRAVQSTGSKDISHIIESYQSRTYGFASKNFYAEFLAVKDAYEDMTQNDNSFGPKNPVVRELKIPAGLSLLEFIRLTKIDRKEIEKYNQCLRPKAYNARQSPSNKRPYAIFLPQNLYTTAKTRISEKNL